MDTGLISMIGFGALAVVVFLLSIVVVYKSLYRKVGPNEVLVISGRKGDAVEDEHGERHRLGFRIVKGGGSLVNPILERVEIMSLELITTIEGLLTVLLIAATAIVAMVQLRHLRSANQIAAITRMQ